MGLLRILLRALFGRSKRRSRSRQSGFRSLPTIQPAIVRHHPSGEVQTSLPKQITGNCRVIDGDTIDINGIRIRLAGIDAPELEDPYGGKAKFALIDLCRGKEVRAVLSSDFSHGRAVATCYLPDGRDISAEMVTLGLAIDWRKFSGGNYRDFEVDGIRKKLWRCDARQKGRMPARA